MRRTKCPCVYILASRRNGTLYIGVASDLVDRMFKHRSGEFGGFTSRYGVKMLVYYEMHDTMDDAIAQETRLKKWKRIWKLRLIEEMNPAWDDLFDERTGDVRDGPADVARDTQRSG